MDALLGIFFFGVCGSSADAPIGVEPSAMLFLRLLGREGASCLDGDMLGVRATESTTPCDVVLLDEVVSGSETFARCFFSFFAWVVRPFGDSSPEDPENWPVNEVSTD